MPSREVIEAEAVRLLDGLRIGLDTEKGPLRDLLIEFHALFTARYSERGDRLVAMTGPMDTGGLLPEELETQARTLGISQPRGRPARGEVVVLFSAIPAGGVTIEQGSRFSDASGTLLYRALEKVERTADEFQALWNAPRRRYEVPVSVASIQVGATAEVPAFRLTQLVDAIPGAIGVTNLERIRSQSVEGLSDTGYANLISAKFQGSAQLTQANLELRPTRIDPQARAATAVSSVSPFFSNRTDRSAIDLYVIGEDLATGSVSVIQDAGTLVELPPGPITEVVSVLADGEPVEYTFEPDTSLLGTSVRALHKVRLAAEPASGTSITVTYLYNVLLQVLQSSIQQNSPIETDVLLFSARPVPLEIDITATTALVDAVTSALLEFYNVNRFGGTYSPESLRSFLTTNRLLASSVEINVFREKAAYRNPVEVVSVREIDYLTLSSDDLIVRTS